MSTPHPDDPTTPRPPSGLDAQSDLEVQRTRAGNSAGLLWALLLIAVIALGYWWFAVRDAGPAPGVPLTEIPAVIEAPAPASPSEPATGSAKAAPTAASEVTTKRPVRATATRAPAPRPANRPPMALASNQQPDYPARALRSGVEGSISVRIDLDAQGVPVDVEVVSRRGERSRELDRAVVNAARNWRFEPAIRNGEAVAASVVVPVDFRRD